MKGMNGKRKKNSSFIIIITILTLLLISMQMALANDQVDVTFMIRKENGPPIIHDNEFPENGSTNVMLKIPCRIQVSDPDYDYLNIYWYEKSTGSWVLRQTDSLVESGTYYWTYSQATEYSTTYYWRVIVNDGDHSVTAIYYFTTKPSSTTPPEEPDYPPIFLGGQNEPPIAKITGPNHAHTNETIVFYANESYDLDGEIVVYRWYFENEDGTFDMIWENDELVTRSYLHPGNYTITLEVIDDDGATGVTSHNISIMKLPPPLQLPIPQINASYYYTYINKNIILPGVNGPYYGYTNENITFNSTGTYDPDGIIINYTWDFGDNCTSYLKNPIHSYAKPGNYTVILKVTDNDNLSNLTTTKAIILDRGGEKPEERELPFTLLSSLIITISVATAITLLMLLRGHTLLMLLRGHKITATRKRRYKPKREKRQRIKSIKPHIRTKIRRPHIGTKIRKPHIRTKIRKPHIRSKIRKPHIRTKRIKKPIKIRRKVRK